MNSSLNIDEKIDKKVDNVKDKILIEDIKTEENKIKNYLDKDILNVKEYSINKANELSSDLNNKKTVNEDEYSNYVSDIQERTVIEGTVAAVNDKGVIIDIGFKSEGVIDRSEFDKIPEIGEKIKVFLVCFESKKGHLILSKERADFEARWDELRSAFTEESIITGKIIKRIKGGFVVDLGVVNAFLPGSQIDVKAVTDYDQYLGNDYEFKIVKFNEFRQNIVVSRKAILVNDFDQHRKEILDKIKVNEVYDGIIKNITDFGAFIDLGGMDGLLHITDITWGRINHPTEKLNLGDQIKVKIIDYNEDNGRISLGTKQLTEDPWKESSKKYEIGKIISGKVVNLMNYGLFLELEEGVEGLIHISEMSWTKHIKHPSDMYKIGDKIDAKVLSINSDDKKISLGIKQLVENPWENVNDLFKSGDIIKGKISNIVNNGCFVSMNDDIEGFLHNNDISWTRKIKSISDFIDIKQSIELKIIDISSNDKRITLSLKDIHEDPWINIDNFINIDEQIDAKVLFKLEKNLVCLMKDIFEGILPITSENIDSCNNLNKDDIICVTINEINKDKRRIVLESKQESADTNNVSIEKKSPKSTKVIDKEEKDNKS